MGDIFKNILIGILSGMVSGIVSGIMIYCYSEQRIIIREIIDYAERTAEKTRLIFKEANEYYNNGKNIESLKTLIGIDVRRGLSERNIEIAKYSKQLKQSIGKCNEKIYEVEIATGTENEAEKLRIVLFNAAGGLNELSLDLDNAIVEYKAVGRRQLKKFIVKLIFWVIVVCVVILIILA